MRRILYTLLIVAVMCLGAVFDAEAKSKNKSKKSSKRTQHVISKPYNPKNASILIEANSGMVLEQDNADWTLYPASLTKLMTLLLLFDAVDSGGLTLQSRIYISAAANRMPPSRLNIDTGDSITVDQAIRVLVTKSANNIAVAVAEKIAGSEKNFALRMNLKARAIGMAHSHFVNASGLHNIGQYSSARDMAKLGQYIYKNKPRYYPYFALKEFYYKGAVSQNHNHLMKEYQGMDGMKTGFITQSGFNLVASAKRNGVRLIGVVIGGKTASSRNAQMRVLLDKGFERMRHVGSVPAPAPVLSAPSRPVAPSMSTIKVPPVPLPAPLSATLAAPDHQSVPVTSALAGSGTWEIQLGAYQDRVSTDQAIYRALQKLPAPLNRAQGIVMPLRTAEAKWIFRARLGGYSKLQAETACRYIEHCLVISPSAH